MTGVVDELKLVRSAELAARARQVIPGGTQTASKRPEAFAPGYFPEYIERGLGSHVWDVDGNEYIDYVMACGPVTLGYCYPPVDHAIQEQLRKGIIFSRPVALEAEVAEMLAELVPCAEMTRFFKGGAEANSAAARIARAYTGREKLASCGYRGWHDQWAITHSPEGIPACLGPLTLEFRYNDLASLEALFEQHPGQIAAVILDAASAEAPANGFLDGVRQITHKNGALLIFDEIVTGFRLATGGAQQYFGVVPDLAVFAKGIANGMPLAALTGRREVMSKATDVFVTLTYGDETLSLAAARATLRVLMENEVSEHIWAVGRSLVKGIQQVLAETGVPFKFGGLEAMPAFSATGVYAGQKITQAEQERAWAYLLGGFARRGVIWRKQSLLLPSFSHTPEDIQHTIAAGREVLAGLAELMSSGRLAEAVPAPGPASGFRRI